MNIMVGLDRGLVKQLGVLMISAYENHPKLLEKSSEGITFYVAYEDFIAHDITIINEIAARYNQVVKFIKVDRNKFTTFLLSDKWRRATAERWPIASYYHLLIHELLPLEVKRALVLDVDIVINGDITEFYNLDFENRPIIVNHIHPNCWDEPENEFSSFDYGENFFVEGETQKKGKLYFNAGVILYNLDKLRELKIDSAFYKNVVEGFKVGITDEKIANHCFARNAKFLRSAKYNYRMAIAQRGYFSYKNRVCNITPDYEFCHLDAKIIHFGGTLTSCKPWVLNFDSNEISHPENEFYLLLPEISSLYSIWWKYAALLPVEWYDKIIHQVDLNKASYNMIKNLAISQRDIFINNLGLETLYVPSEWRLNEILAGDDLNDFVKPKVYRCVDGETKLKVKNTSPDFSQKAGFRLVVKYIAANAGDNTAVLQILEPNVSSAAVYRRYGHRHGNDWGYWYRVATTDYVDEKVKDQLNHVILKIKNEIIRFAKKE